MAKTLKRLVAPAVRFCLRHALHIQDIEAAVKEALVESAARDLARRGQPANISRLSAATGLHRREVMRLVSSGENSTEENASRTEGKGLISRVIGRWQFDKKFMSPARRPRTLTVEGSTGEFAELVRSVSNDLNPGTVLRELERIGAVERTARGVKLTSHVYQTRRDAAEGYRMLGDDLGDLTGSVEENISGKNELPNLHARTEFDNIYSDALPEIREWLLRRGTEFHADVRSYLARFDRDFSKGSGGAGARVIIGTFSLTAQPEIVKPERKKRSKG